MHRHTITLAVVTTFLAACSENNPTAPAARELALPRNASAADHTLPGTPGAPNCQGQTAAYAAQFAKNSGSQDFRGIGGIAVANELSVKEVQAAIDALCTP